MIINIIAGSLKVTYKILTKYIHKWQKEGLMVLRWESLVTIKGTKLWRTTGSLTRVIG